MNNMKKGFALLSVFLMLTLATILVTQLYYKGSLYNSFIPVIVHREKAKRLARCGIPIALNQLALHDKKLTPPSKDDDKKGAQKKNDPEERAKQLLKVLLKVQNRWQTFDFTEAQEGVDGALSVCITCEEGKIPLNKLINYKKRNFRNNKKLNFNGDVYFKDLFDKLKPAAKDQDLYDAMLGFIKESKYELLDVTDLLGFKQFKEMRNNVFYIPPQKDEPSLKKPYLTDIFTLWSKKPTINPFVFSHSVRLLYGLKAEEMNKPLEDDQIEEIIKKVTPAEISWEKDWDTFLKPLYGKDYKSLPKEVVALFTPKFEPRVFSVLCYGKVGNVGQKLLAIVARSFTKQGEEFEVKRIYWL